MEEWGRRVAGIVIEPMRDADVSEVIALELGAGLNSSGRARFEAQLAGESAILLVARLKQSGASGQALVGSISGRVVIDEFQIDNVVVAESARRRGIARVLICEAAKTARMRGADQAVLEVRSRNLAGRLLYQKLGFLIVGQRLSYYREPDDAGLVLTCRGDQWALLSGTEST